MKNNINEWQEMSLKKDVENINKQLLKNRSYEKPLILELYIAVITLVVDKIFDYHSGCDKTQTIILLALLFIATLIFLYAVFVYVKDYLAIRSNIRNSKYNIKPYIDLFDNYICYYALTASNFYENLIDNTSDAGTADLKGNDVSDNKNQFYYIETQYYINKCISELSKMDKVICDVFTDNATDVIYDSKIHFSRLRNIIEMLCDIRTNLYDKITVKCSEESNLISKEYDFIITKFIKKVNNSKKFSSELKWVELKENIQLNHN